MPASFSVCEITQLMQAEEIVWTCKSKWEHSICGKANDWKVTANVKARRVMRQVALVWRLTLRRTCPSPTVGDAVKNSTVVLRAYCCILLFASPYKLHVLVALSFCDGVKCRSLLFLLLQVWVLKMCSVPPPKGKAGRAPVSWIGR